jgi:hypothetical protein
MINRQPSLEGARKVSLSHLTAYLLARGWRESDSGQGAIFSIDLPGADQTISVLLSNRAGSDDEQRRIADALETLAAVEERTIAEIAQEIANSGDRLPRASRSSAGDLTTRTRSVGVHPISKIDGMPVFAASKLKSAGIRTMEGLLEAARTAKGRQKLSEKSGFSEQQLLEWANLADMMRIAGMGKAKAELLRASGVSTLRELTHRNPTRLAQAMRDANEKRKRVAELPSEKAVSEKAVSEEAVSEEAVSEEAVSEEAVKQLIEQARRLLKAIY